MFEHHNVAAHAVVHNRENPVGAPLGARHHALLSNFQQPTPGCGSRCHLPLIGTLAEHEFLQKPFTMDALLHKVREVLDKKKK